MLKMILRKNLSKNHNRRNRKLFLESLADHYRIIKKKNFKAANDKADRYLELDLESETYINPLDFWKDHKMEFPIGIYGPTCTVSQKF